MAPPGARPGWIRWSRCGATDVGELKVQILADLPFEAPVDLIERGRLLDNFYVPTRYPNGHPSGAPFEHYGPIQSDLAIA